MLRFSQGSEVEQHRVRPQHGQGRLLAGNGTLLGDPILEGRVVATGHRDHGVRLLRGAKGVDGAGGVDLLAATGHTTRADHLDVWEVRVYLRRRHVHQPRVRIASIN